MTFIPLSVRRWAKSRLSEWIAQRGYQISKVKTFDESTALTAFDIQARVIADSGVRPIIFDVGANRGQTIARYRKLFPAAEIHAFEPVTEFFNECRRKSGGDAQLVLNNIALSDTEGEVVFHETIGGQTSSVLTKSGCIPSYFSEGDFTESRTYKVKTGAIDKYCLNVGIQKIDILKMDTEGYELTVLKGASGILRAGGIRLVYTEVNFERFWNDCALYHHIASFLEGFEMDLFALYGTTSGALGTAKAGDALFIRREDKRHLLREALTKPLVRPL